MSKLWTNSLECDGDCGTKIEITARREIDAHEGALHGVAETLGWKTVDQKTGRKKVNRLVFCAFCQERAKLIHLGQ